MGKSDIIKVIMGLKKSKGNMYDWVTHMHSHLAGECPHGCSYCYVQRNRFGVHPKYKGNPRIIKSELNVDYGEDKIIFIEHMDDLFAEGVESNWIVKILTHCRKYNKNKYIFQSKNPTRALPYLYMFPKDYMFGTTIETNGDVSNISKAPKPHERYLGIKTIKSCGKDVFVTIEPIMDFDMELADWIIDIEPEFINIGADSKHCNLPEPSAKKILEFINILNENKITIKKKTNLGRLIN